jgi:hypothetical protein
MKHPVVVTVLVLPLVAAAVAYAAVLRPRLLTLHQVGNHATCQGVQHWIENERERTGKLPIALPASESLDAWGHALHYQRLRPDGYLLVSFGRDGKPDGSDYLALRNLGDHPPGYSICGKYDADEVMSDKGWHRICGK